MSPGLVTSIQPLLGHYTGKELTAPEKQTNIHTCILASGTHTSDNIGKNGGVTKNYVHHQQMVIAKNQFKTSYHYHYIPILRVS